MWTRRMYLEIVSPFVAWFRGTEIAEEGYRGHRILQPEALRSNRQIADRGLNQLDDDLEGRTFIAGDEITMADILLYAFMAASLPEVSWLNVPQPTNVAAWFARMSNRDSAKKMLEPLPRCFEV